MFELIADIREVMDLPEDFKRDKERRVLFALSAIESAAVEEAPHATGNLVNAVTTRKLPDGGEVFVSGAAPYGVYVHEGTGIFGPKKKPIKPRNAKALRFVIAGQAVFAGSVKGQKANPFMDRAADKAEPVVVQILGGIDP